MGSSRIMLFHSRRCKMNELPYNKRGERKQFKVWGAWVGRKSRVFIIKDGHFKPSQSKWKVRKAV